jgi:predicted lipoprotein with Yx(FWY)xxD motif
MKHTYIVVAALLALSLVLTACGAQANPTSTPIATSMESSTESTTMEPSGTVEGTATTMEGTATLEGTSTQEGGIPNTGNGTDTPSAGSTSRASATLRASGTPQTSGTPGGSRTPAASVTIKVSQDATYGSYLVDGQGMALYLFADDTSGTSTCSDTCADDWPPLVTTGSATAGTGVDASKLGTTTRTDGSTQVTYNGWPLYYFDEDQQAGDVNGQGQDNFFLVSPEGNKINQ